MAASHHLNSSPSLTGHYCVIYEDNKAVYYCFYYEGKRYWFPISMMYALRIENLVLQICAVWRMKGAIEKPHF